MKFFLNLLVFSSFLLPQTIFARDLFDIKKTGTDNTSIQNDMLPDTNTIMGNSKDIGGGTQAVFPVLTEFKNILFGTLAIISIAVFIYLGFKLAIAQGKPDEFKKAMMGFVYAVIGLAIIPLAWAMVKLISSLQF